MSTYYSPQPTAPSAFGFLNNDEELMHSIATMTGNANGMYGPPTPPLSSSGSSIGGGNMSSMASSTSCPTNSHHVVSSGLSSALNLNTSNTHDPFMHSSDCGTSNSLYSAYAGTPTSAVSSHFSTSGMSYPVGAATFSSAYSSAPTSATDYHSPATSYASLSSSAYSTHPYGQTPTSYSALWNTPPPSAELPQLSFSPVVDHASMAGTGSYGYSHRPSSGTGLMSELSMNHGVSGIPLSPLLNKHMVMGRQMVSYEGLDAAPNMMLLPQSQLSSSAGYQSRPITSRVSANRSMHTRSITPNTAGDLRAYGYLNEQGTWSCAYSNCTSKAVFSRGCDLRKHYKRHTKTFFCQHDGCPQARGGGFSSRKDLARHEAKHNPGVGCEWPGCARIFSRVDNMRDHVKRIHHKGARQEYDARRAASKGGSTASIEASLPGVVASVSSHDSKPMMTTEARPYSLLDSKMDYSSSRRVVLPSVTLPSMLSFNSGSSSSATLPGLSSMLPYPGEMKPNTLPHQQSLVA